jgi:uncharacterized membrane protein
MRDGHIDIGHLVPLLLYFATFTILALLWLSYHRMMSGTYTPSGVDLIIPFAYLALVSLVPYALYQISHDTSSAANARSALLEYLLLYAATMALASVLALRNLRRGYFFLNDEERNLAWLLLLRQAVLCAMMTISLGIDLVAGALRAGTFLLFIYFALLVARKRFPTAPSPARLRISAPSRRDGGADSSRSSASEAETNPLLR